MRDRLAIALTLAACLAAWLVFWDFGRLGLTSHDWPKEAYYLDALREGLLERRIPFYAAYDTQGTTWLLANPELPLSPQLLLLLILDNGTFVAANAVLLWLLGVLGLLLYREEQGIALLPFLLLLLLFSFNGHIIAHLAVGHSMWSGYFLAPFALLPAFRLIEEPPQARDALLLGMALAAMLLQGAFHLVVYLGLFVALLGLLLPRRLGWILLAFLACLLLAAVRILPAIPAFGGHARPFISGYPGLGVLLDGLTAIRPPGTPPLAGFTGEGLFWWEYDAYLGPVGLAFLLAGLVGLARDRRPPARALLAAILAMIVLSFGEAVYLLGRLGVPVLGQERAPARFLVVPLLALLLLAARSWTRLAPAPGPIGLLALLLAAAGLLVHLLVWRIAGLEAAPAQIWQLHPRAALTSPAYERLWLVALAVSVAAWLAALAFLARTRGNTAR